MELFALNAGNFKLDGGACFGVVPKTIWSKFYESDDFNLLPVSTRCLLVSDSNRLILIDTGIGDKQDGKFRDHLHLFGHDNLLTSLAGAGFSPDDITDVLHTHLHYDHCGGSVQWNKSMDGFEPAFKNATYWVSKEQWERAMNPNDRERPSYLNENLMPMAESGRLQMIGSGGAFAPGIELRIFHGHTAGQIIPLIDFCQRKVAFMADFIPTSSHIPIPYIASFDTMPLVAMEEKKLFLEEAVAGNYILFFEHDFYHECCTLQNTPKGVRVKECGSLHSIMNSSLK